MKKRILAILSTIVAFVLSLSVFAGCKLVTKDTERDMNQVVATVNIVKEDKIYKKDMVLAFLNYGYLYVNYSGMSQSETFELILDSLINDRILVQNAMVEFEADSDFDKSESVAKYEIERYLTEEELVNAKYNAYRSVNNMLDSYVAKDEENKSNELTETVRKAPEGAANAVETLNLQEKKDYINKGFDISSTAERAKAFNKFIRLLKNNGLLGEKYLNDKNATITDTEYFNQTLINNKETELLEKYENYKLKKFRTITFEELSEEFAKIINEQKNMSYADFKSLLSSASADEPVLYGAYGKFGYVYNLLLSASNEQLDELTQWKEENPNATPSQYVEEQRNVLKETTVKDMRSTWILSGYDFDSNTNKFLNDYAVAGEDSLPFKGTVNWVNKGEYEQEIIDKEGVKIAKYSLNGEINNDYKPQYNVAGLDVFSLSDMETLIKDYVYGGNGVRTELEGEYYSQFKPNGIVDNYDEKVQELLYAFSGDSGSIGTYKGYTISPDNSEGWINSFWEAGQKLFTDELGEQSYIIVFGDTVGSGNPYAGCFILFYSELIGKNNELFENSNESEWLESYLNATFGEKDWEAELERLLENWADLKKADTSSYLYKLVNSLTSADVSSKYETERKNMTDKYHYGEEKAVKVYEKRYADLVK